MQPEADLLGRTAGRRRLAIPEERCGNLGPWTGDGIDTSPWGGGTAIIVSGGTLALTPASQRRDQLDRKPGLAHRQHKRQVEFLRLQLGDLAAAGNHDRDPLAEVFHADPAAGPFFDPQLIPRNGRIAVNQETLHLALRPPAKFQGACIVVELLPLNGIGNVETKRHCSLLKRSNEPLTQWCNYTAGKRERYRGTCTSRRCTCRVAPRWEVQEIRII